MWLSRALRLTITALAALVVALTWPSASFGAPALGDLSDPNDGQTMAVSPAQLSLVFTESLTQAPGIVVQTADNQPVTGVGAVVRGDDDQTWYVPINVPLPNATYKVTWSADGQAGTYQFTIGAAQGAAQETTQEPAQDTGTVASDTGATDGTAPATTAASTPSSTPASSRSTSDAARLLNTFARWLAYFTLGALAGALLLIALVWNEGVEYVLTGRYLRLVWFAALVAVFANVIATRAVMAGESLGASVSPGSWGDLSDNLAGLATLARLVLVLASGWVVFGPDRVVDEATQIPAFLAPMLAVVTFAFTRAEDGLDLFLTPVAALHLLSFAAWFGGAALLWRVVLAGSGDNDLVQAVYGFGRIANQAMIGVVVSGVLLLARLVGGFGNLFSTGYGRLMFVKALAVAGMVYVGLTNRQTVAARLGRARHLDARPAMRLRRAIGTEVGAGVLVLGLTGWMIGSHPPGLEVPIEKTYAKPTIIVGPLINSRGLEMEVGIGPGVAGSNDITITVKKPATGLVDLLVRLDPLDVYVDSIEIPAAQLDGKGELVVPGVPLAAPGRWQVTVTGASTDGDLGRLESEFTLPSPASAGG